MAGNVAVEAAGDVATGSDAKRRRLEDEDVDSDDGDDDADAADGDEYFQSYGDLGIHVLMLSDAPRVGAYMAAICNHKAKIAGRVVLDVGAGSGILSLLAARHGGAARVYAVEAAPEVAQLARQLIARNGLESTIRVVEGRMEEVELPEQVDVIISEWMGFYLLHESMLESVLEARVRWLRPGGIMLPSSARIWAVPVDADEFRREVENYRDFHGLDLGFVGDLALSKRCAKPQVELVESNRLLANPVLAVDLGDLATRAPGSTTELTADVRFVATRTGHVAAVALWFDVGFGVLTQRDHLELSTGPGAPATHWMQTVIYLGQFVPVQPGDVLPTRLVFKQSADNPRHYDITIETT